MISITITWHLNPKLSAVWWGYNLWEFPGIGTHILCIISAMLNSLSYYGKGVVLFVLCGIWLSPPSSALLGQFVELLSFPHPGTSLIIKFTCICIFVCKYVHCNQMVMFSCSLLWVWIWFNTSIQPFCPCWYQDCDLFANVTVGHPGITIQPWVEVK